MSYSTEHTIIIAYFIIGLYFELCILIMWENLFEIEKGWGSCVNKGRVN
jgi:hypothetical protein